MSSARRVVITGLGATTPLGGSFADTWDGLLAGRSGMRTMDFPWVEEFEMPAKFAALLHTSPEEVLSKVECRRMDPSTQYAMVAAKDAWADAGAPDASAPVSWQEATRRFQRKLLEETLAACQGTLVRNELVGVKQRIDTARLGNGHTELQRLVDQTAWIGRGLAISTGAAKSPWLRLGMARGDGYISRAVAADCPFGGPFINIGMGRSCETMRG